MPALAEVLSVLDTLYDPRTAQEWDAVGLVCGDPDAPVKHVHFAVDPVAAVADEAIAMGAQLLVTHHPLFLRPVSSFAATTPKGRVTHRLISAGVALHVAHTNADVADPGVSDALAGALRLRDCEPLSPDSAEPLDKLVTFVPTESADAVLDALASAGAGAIGDYDRCAWTTTGTGTFRPGQGASPTIGTVGSVETVAETRLEMVLPRGRRASVVRALLSAHPYEEPAYDVFELAMLPGRRGLGRIGDVPFEMTLGQFVRHVSVELPRTAGGVRASGDPETVVRRVAVCGGAGDSLIEQARAAGADAYVTADLRHHPTSEARERGDMALVDVAHWASEWPWLADAAARLHAGISERTGDTVTTTVSTLDTDPWTLHAPEEDAPRL